jgi:hypothetical protein
MIRGAIDYIGQNTVAGWLHSEQVDLRDTVVLAFVGDQCVGAGKIERFRQDLADAGLGDGYVGFSFGATVPHEADWARIVVRLEGSDLCLLQAKSAVQAASAHPSPPVDRSLGYSKERLEWIRSRGWLGQAEFDFVRSISVTGCYDRSLRLDRVQLADPAEEAHRLIELFQQTPVQLRKETLEIRQLSEWRLETLAAATAPIIAIHASEGAVRILEGSQHDEGEGRTSDMIGSVQHKLGSDRLLFVDLRAHLGGVGPGYAEVYVSA